MPNRIRVIIHNHSRLLRESMLNILDGAFEVIDPQARLNGAQDRLGDRLNGAQDRATASSPIRVNGNAAWDGRPPDIVLFDLPSLKVDAWNFRSWYGEKAQLAMIADEFSPHYMRVALRFGVRGYLLNRMSSTAFVLALRLIHEGEPVFPEESLEHFSPAPIRKAPDDGSLPVQETELFGYPGLYPRHARILKLIMDGNSNKEIARELDLTEDLVKLHVRHIMQTINVRNRTQAALWAAQSGIIQDMEYFAERTGS
ncbi:LuxR C-terminal-related transcriptional regulator [Azospirillum doebereinerae]|uniref:Response regulator transcription factor n=1 Tax=Azospirillum doebereinerae TaxID=92933 RepID=A0A3S0WKF7_9PROT|nr:response regulator transcription factor [Azospirillum doebereinerae]MCG5239357.1 response regulator transcription factor [Azospirillum doebereinerae]RUQ67853.1 response regulator transcription factor [Azospirillum doebereinerae]